MKLYKERGDRVANRIREIEQDEKNNYRMIKKLAEEYDLDLEGRDYPSYRDLDRVARYIMGFPTSYDDKAMMANIPKLFGAKDEDDLLKRLDYIEHLPSKNGNIRITNEKDMALLKETAMKGDDAINKLYESLIMTDSAVLERLSSYEEYQKKMLPYFLKHYDNELELPSDPEERKKLEELNKGLDYKLKMFRRGVLDISIERLGNHAMSDAVKDSEELFRDATRELIQSVAEDKAETDKEEIEKRTEEIIENIKDKEKENGSDSEYLDVLKDINDVTFTASEMNDASDTGDSSSGAVFESMSVVSENAEIRGLLVDQFL